MKWVAIVAALIIGAVLSYRQIYNWQFNALEREIRRHPHLKIIGHWRHEDVSLEDFSFTVAGRSSEFEISIFDGSHVRMPSDRASGLVIDWRDSGEMDVLPLNGSYWKAQKLPPVENIADFLPHADEVLSALAAHPTEATIPAKHPWPLYLDHIYIVVRKKPGVLPGQKTDAIAPALTAP